MSLCQAYFKSEKGREERKPTPSQQLFMPFKATREVPLLLLLLQTKELLPCCMLWGSKTKRGLGT